MTEGPATAEGAPPQPPALARAAAFEFVRRHHMRLTHPSDSRLGPLAPDYELGVALWTGDRAAFVGFYTPDRDPEQAGRDLAARCEVAGRWAHERLAIQGAKRADVLLVAMGPVAGSLLAPTPGGAVSVGAVSVDPVTERASQILPSPSGFLGARELRSIAEALNRGAEAPTLAAVDLAERTQLREGRVGAARTTLLQTPVATYSLIASFVAIWVLEHIVTQANPSISSDDFGTFFTGLGADQWWRWIASGFLHQFDNPAHVILNSASMFFIGRFVEAIYGRRVLIGVFLLSVVAGSLGVEVLNAAGIYNSGMATGALGASGGICGLVGLLVVMGRVQGRGMPVAFADSVRRQSLLNVAFILAYGFLIPGIAWPAHLGGFIAGALAGLLFPPRPAVGGRELSLPENAAIGAVVAVSAVALIAALLNVISAAG